MSTTEHSAPIFPIVGIGASAGGLAHALTASHGGEVAVSSSAEEGTTFSIILPLDSRTK